MRNFLVLLAGSLILFCSLNAEAYRLEFRDPLGAQRKYQSNWVINGTADVLGMIMPISAQLHTFSSETVNKQLADGTSDLTYQFLKGTMNVKIDTPFDAEAPAISQPIPDFSMTFNRDKFGKLRNIQMTGVAAELFGTQFDALNSQLQAPGQGLVFPDRDLKIGDTWDGTQRLELGNGRQVNAVVKYTLLALEQQAAKEYLVITSDINLTVAIMPVPLGIGGLLEDTGEVNMKLVLQGKCRTLFDFRAGEVGDSGMKLQAKMTMTAAGEDGFTSETQFTMDGTTVRMKE